MTGNALINSIAIGARSKVDCNDCMVLGSIAGVNENQVKVGIGYTNPSTTVATDNFLLYVQGVACSTCIPGTSSRNSAFFNGDTYNATIWYPSDSSLKDNVQPLLPGVATAVLNSLQPKTYTFDQQNNLQLNLPGGVQAGLIAEEVKQVVPGLVKSITAPAILDSLGTIVHPELTFDGINYPGFIPYLIQARKEDQQRMDLQDHRMDSLAQVTALLTARIDACCSMLQPSPGGRVINPNPETIELKNSESVILKLGDAVPNPFAENTTISYTLPTSVKQAQLIFYESSGKVLRTVDISTRGDGAIKVYAPDLSSGIYQYSLITDGKLVETKKMVKTN
ncbi:hypothetical protein BH11BAC1_BH11BAC1_13520 [soil metagenome]